MKVLAAILFATTVFVTTVVDAGAQDFRGIEWGTHVEEVLETGHPSVKYYTIPGQHFDDEADQFSGVYQFPADVENRDGLIGFFVVRGKIYRGRHRFPGGFGNNTEHLFSYNQFLQILTDRYGVPDVNVTADEADDGLPSASWTLPSSTVVRLTVSGSAMSWKVDVNYLSPRAVFFESGDWHFSSYPLRFDGHDHFAHRADGNYQLEQHTREELEREHVATGYAIERYCPATGNQEYTCPDIWNVNVKTERLLKILDADTVDLRQTQLKHPVIGALVGHWCNEQDTRYNVQIEIDDELDYITWLVMRYPEEQQRLKVDVRDDHTIDASRHGMSSIHYKRLILSGDEGFTEVFSYSNNPGYVADKYETKNLGEIYWSDGQKAEAYFRENLGPEMYSETPRVYSRCSPEEVLGWD